MANEEVEVLGSLRRKTQDILIENEAGQKVRYQLREMDGLGRDAYEKLVETRTIRDPQGNARGVRDSSGLRGALLEKCLYDEVDHPIMRETIQKWPATLVHALFERALALNGLDQESAKDLGNA